MYIIYFSYLYIFTPDCRILLILELFQDTVEIKQTIKTGKSLNESEVEPVAIHLENGCLMNSAAKRTKMIDHQALKRSKMEEPTKIALWDAYQVGTEVSKLKSGFTN